MRMPVISCDTARPNLSPSTIEILIALTAGIRDEEPKRLYVESLRQAGLPE